MSSALNATIDRLYGNPDAFVSRLRSRMQLYGIKQVRLAERAGYTPVEVWRWLHRKRKPELAAMLVLDEAIEQLIETKGARIDAASIS